MTFLPSLKTRMGAFLVALLTVSALPAAAETPVGSNVDSRVLIGLSANSDGINALMPEGWTSIPFPNGPMKGANLMVGLIDQHLARDPDGKPADPATRLAAAVVGLGKETEGNNVRMYVLSLVTTNPASDPYSNAIAADISRTRVLEGTGAPGRKHSENWIIRPEGGGEIAFSLNYTTGTANWAPGELNPYSAAKPDFSRIYRYQQLVDLALSEGLGKSLNGDVSFSSSSERFSAIFDGSEKVMAVMTVPVYIREISLP